MRNPRQDGLAGPAEPDGRYFKFDRARRQ
jgi:hypothetical protein